MSGSAFENSIKRKIYVYAAIEDSDECKRLKGIIDDLNYQIDDHIICTKCYKMYDMIDRMTCNVCRYTVVCNHCGKHGSCTVCNCTICMDCWDDKNIVCNDCI